MNQNASKQKAFAVLRRLRRRAPLVLCLVVLGAVYLLMSLFGLTGAAAEPGAKDDPSALASQEPGRTVSSGGAQDPGGSEPSGSAQNPDGSGVQTEPADTASVTTEPVATEPITTAPETTEAPTTEEPGPTEPPQRAIYLTFDDGPGKNTEKVLEILDRYGVRATFFTVGYYVDHYPEIAAKITEHGQLIACHSYTHEYDQCYASADAFMNELEQWKQAVQNACGSVPERICVRFPGGSKTPNAKNCSDEIKRRLAAANIHWFDWNAANSDKYPKGNTKKLPDEEYFWESYKQTIGWYVNDPGAQVIFLTHDSVNGTVAMLPRMIEDLLDRGYVFKTLDQHPEWDE